MADIDPQDLTFQVHAEAMREVQREEEENQSSFRQDDVAFRQINERIYFLLLKNVSREDPLTPEEVQVFITTTCDMDHFCKYLIITLSSLVFARISIVHVW